ncbi:hypothetical protein F4678DRAFT_463750 [Xylaria arbuscula]|nr:hypothetical protein F4678DRAFT_463750 [Xylaria arbuscula]
MLYLADAPWSRLPSRRDIGAPRTAYTYGVVALVAIGFIQLVLQSALVTSEELQVATDADVPGYVWTSNDDPERFSILGVDSTPNRMNNVPLGLVTKEYDGSLPFVTAFPSGTHTGALRYHVMRLNKSVSCEAVPRASFPDSCPGLRPFSGNLSLPSRDDENDPTFGSPAVSLRWCVPGNTNSTGWSDNRNRQNISEEMFVDFFVPEGPYYFGESFTTHCSASTIRRYFELPNFHNNLTFGPLLETRSNYPYGNKDWITPGPLTTAMISMLGNESWILPLQNITNTTDPSTLNAIYRDMCTGGIPFLNWDDEDPVTPDLGFSNGQINCTIAHGSNTGPLRQIKDETYVWFSFFGETSRVNRTLASAALIANEATLTRSAVFVPGFFGPGTLYTAPGSTVHKPRISLAAEIVISVFIGVETLAIIALMLYIRRTPTFTDRLDALVVATIGAQLSAAGAELPALQETGKTRFERLREHDGVIGLSHGSLMDEEESNTSDRRARTHSGNDNVELDTNDEPPAPSLSKDLYRYRLLKRTASDCVLNWRLPMLHLRLHVSRYIV